MVFKSAQFGAELGGAPIGALSPIFAQNARGDRNFLKKIFEHKVGYLMIFQKISMIHPQAEFELRLAGREWYVYDKCVCVVYVYTKSFL